MYNTRYSVLHKNTVHDIERWTMNKYSVFNELDPADLAGLSECLGFEEQVFNKGEIIMRFSSDNKKSGILLSGLAYLKSINDEGEENILDYYEGGNLFGSALTPHTNVNLYYIAAKKKSSVYFFPHDLLVKKCKNNCEKHTKFINNTLVSISCRSQIHIDILSQRTIRGKLMIYFAYLAELGSSKNIRLPIPLSDLSGYICADRSAMMREIKNMNDDGLISSKGQNILLL